MKWLFNLILFLGIAFGGGFYAGRTLYPLVSCSFHPTQYPVLNRAFVFAVVGRNNGAYLEKTLRSVLSQNYENYRIVYIDDGSNDGSFELARDRLFESKRTADLMRNETPQGLVSNLSRVVRDCKDDEIVVVLDGSDWLAHEWVLARLNQYYANSGLWITYGRYCEYPQYSLGKAITPGRDKPFSPLLLNTFYAGLFKQIGGTDFSGSDEMAYMLPMLEMAKGHSTYIPEVLYVVNGMAQKEIIRDDHSEKLIRAMASYEPLMKWGSSE